MRIRTETHLDSMSGGREGRGSSWKWKDGKKIEKKDRKGKEGGKEKREGIRKKFKEGRMKN